MRRARVRAHTEQQGVRLCAGRMPRYGGREEEQVLCAVNCTGGTVVGNNWPYTLKWDASSCSSQVL